MPTPTNDTFRIEDGTLIRTVVPRRGKGGAYEHACTDPRFRALAQSRQVGPLDYDHRRPRGRRRWCCRLRPPTGGQSAVSRPQQAVHRTLPTRPSR